MFGSKTGQEENQKRERTMVIVRLMGGLGNQMFQYAAGRSLAEGNEEQLQLDISYFEKDPIRYYHLNHFNIEECIASTDEIAKLTKQDQKQGWMRTTDCSIWP
ncbi:hypothetical protein ACFL0Q_06130, partial [Thermodesulfobacteriota bacterium]